jgi:hypothetical protein
MRAPLLVLVRTSGPGPAAVWQMALAAHVARCSSSAEFSAAPPPLDRQLVARRPGLLSWALAVNMSATNAMPNGSIFPLPLPLYCSGRALACGQALPQWSLVLTEEPLVFAPFSEGWCTACGLRHDGVCDMFALIGDSLALVPEVVEYGGGQAGFDDRAIAHVEVRGAPQTPQLLEGVRTPPP